MPIGAGTSGKFIVHENRVKVVDVWSREPTLRPNTGHDCG
jgi:hypothetical protein